MKQWWITRSPRERLLVVIAAFLLGGALIWQLGIKPSFDALDRAKLAHQRASQTQARLDRIEDLLSQGEAIRPARRAAPDDADAVRGEISALGSSAGLAISGAEVTGSGSVRIALTDATAPAIFTWIEQAETGLGLTVISADLRQNAAGGMDAEVEFSPDGAR